MLEGAFRPGHYQGVTQVVHKFFKLIKPDRAYFGQKDFQQFLVISRMVHLLEMPVELICCPTLREPDGLAMSSRNIHLSPAGRKEATLLSKALFLIKDIARSEEHTSELQSLMRISYAVFCLKQKKTKK